MPNSLVFIPSIGTCNSFLWRWSYIQTDKPENFQNLAKPTTTHADICLQNESHWFFSFWIKWSFGFSLEYMLSVLVDCCWIRDHKLDCYFCMWIFRHHWNFQGFYIKLNAFEREIKWKSVTISIWNIYLLCYIMKVMPEYMYNSCLLINNDY